jgi:hypothetical protein
MALTSLGKKFSRVAPAAAAVVLIMIATGCSAGCSASVSIGKHKTGGTFDDHGVSFKIPDGWRKGGKASYGTQTGGELWSEGFGRHSGHDMVIISAYATKVAITKGNSDRYADAVASAIKGLFAAAGGTISSGPTSTILGGMAGYRFEGSLPMNAGDSLASDLALVWNGHTEYYINCQHVVGGSNSADVARGCTTIENSFKLSSG